MADGFALVEAEDLRALATSHCFIDARSPSEFLAGHIPGAVNIPILNDAQRHDVGVCYKQQGKEAAVELGFQLVGGDFIHKIRLAKECAQHKPVLVYCWRGGQRSAILSWLLSTAGLSVTRLVGGYKSYRQFSQRLFSKPLALVMITGKTGSGKTEILRELMKHKEYVLDLEGFASHRGSAFGGIEMPPQPTQEQFENLLAWQLAIISDGLIWIEGESRFIGKLRIPDHLFSQMQDCRSIQIDQSSEQRMHRILSEYGEYDREILKEKTLSISKRMGGDRVKVCIDALTSDNMQGWLLPLMEYYDKTYMHSIEARKIRPIQFNIEGLSMESIISEIIAHGKDSTP